MLHWPDSMFTYLDPDGILMPNDAFGQHYAASFRFNDQVNPQELYEEALKYYANIIAPYSSRVGPKIDEIVALKLPITLIAPSHGILWRQDPLQIVTRYRDWAAQKGTANRRGALRHDVASHAPHGRGRRRRAEPRRRALQAVPHGHIRPQRCHRRDLQGPRRS